MQTLSCATCFSNSSLPLVTDPSQNRLQTLNYLSPFLLWLLSCLFLCDLLAAYTSSKQLCSSADPWIFHIPSVKTYTLSLALFLSFFFSCFFFFCFYCAPKQSNSHPSDIRHHQSFHAFRTALETCLYKQKQYIYEWFQILPSFFWVKTEHCDWVCHCQQYNMLSFQHVICRILPCSWSVLSPRRRRKKSCHWKGL